MIKDVFQFKLNLDILYQDASKLEQSYVLYWDTTAKPFERYMNEILNSILVCEEKDVDKIDVKRIDFVSLEPSYRDEVKAFAKHAGIEVRY